MKECTCIVWQVSDDIDPTYLFFYEHKYFKHKSLRIKQTLQQPVNLSLLFYL